MSSIEWIGVTLAGSLVTSLVTSFATVHLSLWRFYSEKLWERKVDAYTVLIERLDDMRFFQASYLEDYLENRLETEETKAVQKEVLMKHRIAKREVERLVVTENFIVSQHVTDDLKKLQQSIAVAWKEHDQQDSYSIAEDTLSAVVECIKSVREHAKRDLRITRRWWDPSNLVR